LFFIFFFFFFFLKTTFFFPSPPPSAKDHGRSAASADGADDEKTEFATNPAEQDVINRMITETGFPRNVVLHSLIVHSGNVRRALDYMRGNNPPHEAPWDLQEDAAYFDLMDMAGLEAEAAESGEPLDKEAKATIIKTRARVVPVIARAAMNRGMDEVASRFRFLDAQHDPKADLARIAQCFATMHKGQKKSSM
jgi:hypothetical protein